MCACSRNAFNVSPVNASTPIHLQEFEEPFPSDVELYSIKESSNCFGGTDDSDHLFLGSNLTTEGFFRSFNFLKDRHKLSKLAKEDFLKLFFVSLPRSNNINSQQYKLVLPSIVMLQQGKSSIVCADLLSQLQRVLEQNTKNIIQSWSPDCSWRCHSDTFSKGEVQLVINFDGASVLGQKTLQSSLFGLKFSIYPLT